MNDKCTMSSELHKSIAVQLLEAEQKNEPVEILSQTYPDITLQDAYAIQWEGLKLRREMGEVIVGRKTGLTSRGVMEMLNWYTPDYSYLTASTRIEENSVCLCSELNIPLVEGELAFILGKDLKEGLVTDQDVIDATSWVMPSIEIIDSRYPVWNGVTAFDSISDRAAGARFMLSNTKKRIGEIDPRCIGMVLEKNGELLDTAAGAEVLGNPVTAVAWLANQMIEDGEYLKKDDIVLSGAFMAAYPAKAGDIYTLTLDGFPPMTVSFE